MEHGCFDFRVEGCDLLEEFPWWVTGLMAPVGIGDLCFVKALGFQCLVGELEVNDCLEGFCFWCRFLRGLRVSGDEDFLSRGLEEFVRCVSDILYLDYGEVCNSR